jgi:serine/threonine protein kinase/Tol biopolymer transport system component/DNA-binding winged helix-turn-helix (wHTH) protein
MIDNEVQYRPHVAGDAMATGPAKIQDGIRFGEEFELDLRDFQLRRAGRAVKLERIPMEIFILLIERAGHLVTREEIAERIWGKDVFLDTDNSTNSAVRKIRQALRDDPEQPRFVQTVVGRGYLFIASQLRPNSAEGAPAGEGKFALDGSLIGRRIGDYRPLELIGGGGMGVVYKAEDLRLGRQVAIKFLSTELVNTAGALERMQRGAHIASTLDHPNICPIYQLAEFEGQLFIVMPLLDGGTLREWIESRRTQSAETCVREILSVAFQISEGLEAAHSRGILHSDIQPANIFITSNGEVKILDFGVAKILNEGGTAGREIPVRPKWTTDFAAAQTNPSTGTPVYLSPEQILGETLDERADLFCFGSVLYEMCTGHRAFERESVAAIREAIVSEEPPPIREWRPELPVKLEAIVRKAMERDRERRYQTAAEIGAELSALRAELDTLAAEAAPKREQAQASDWKAIWPRAAVGLTAATLLACAAVWILMWSDRQQPFRDFAITQITDTGRAEQAAISPDGKYVVHVQDENGMKSLRLRNIVTGSDTEILAPESTRFKSLAFAPDGNYVYFRRLVNSIGSEWDEFRMAVLGSNPERVVRDVDSDVTFSPEGTRLSYVRANDPDKGRYRVLRANLGGSNESVLTVQKINGFGNDAYPPFDAWSPDGKQIVYTFAKMADEPGVIRVLNVATGRFGTLQHFPDLLTFDIHWLPSGKWLLVVHSPRGGESGSAQISAFSLADRKLHPVTRDANSYSSLSLSADGKVAAVVQARSLSYLGLSDMDAHGVRPRKDAMPGSLGNVRSFEWADNDHLLVSDGAKLLRVDISNGKSTELFSEAQGTIVGLSQCATGAIVINLEFPTGNVSSEIWKVNPGGSNPTRLSDGRYDMSPACSPDGKWVYYLDGMQRVKRVPLEGGRPEAIGGLIANVDRVLGTFGFSPDGNRMVALVENMNPSSNHMQARLAIFDLKDGSRFTPRLLVPAPEIYAGSLHSGGAQFSPDGNSVAYAIKRNGVGNLWTQPLDGSPGHVVTDYSSDVISHFRFSPDGSMLAVSRVHTVSDIVVLRDAASH